MSPWGGRNQRPAFIFPPACPHPSISSSHGASVSEAACFHRPLSACIEKILLKEQRSGDVNKSPKMDWHSLFWIKIEMLRDDFDIGDFLFSLTTGRIFVLFSFLRFWQSVCWRTAEDDREMTRLIIVWKLQLPSVFFSFFFFFFEKVMWSTMWKVNFTSDLQLRTIWLQKTLIYCNGVAWASCYFQSLTERVTELKMWFLLLCSMEKLTTYRFGMT